MFLKLFKPSGKKADIHKTKKAKVYALAFFDGI
jgi:hypothetical protein